MKHKEFYRKYKVSYPPMISMWNIVLIMVVVALIVPLFVYKNVRSIPFSLYEYLKQIEYFMFIGVPFGAFLFWTSWRQSVKRRRRYCWVGKFEVIGKQSSFLSCNLNLSPGERNNLKVDKGLFNKIQIGDFIIIRRNALGGVDEVRRVKDVLNRLTRAAG